VTSDAILAIIFIATLLIAGVFHSGIKKPILAKVILVDAWRGRNK
jgi:hypothetical protein